MCVLAINFVARGPAWLVGYPLGGSCKAAYTLRRLGK